VPLFSRIKITFGLLLTIRFVSTTTISMKCLPNWTPLNSHVRFKQNKTLKFTETKPLNLYVRMMVPMAGVGEGGGLGEEGVEGRTKILEPPIHLDPATNYFTPSIEPRGI